MSIIYHCHILFVWCERYQIDGFIYVWASGFSWVFSGEKVFSQRYLLGLGPLEKSLQSTDLGGCDPCTPGKGRCWLFATPGTELTSLPLQNSIASLQGCFWSPKKKKKEKNFPYWASTCKKELKFGAFPHPKFLPGPGFQPIPAKKEVNKGKMKSYLLGLITIIKTGWVGKHDSAPEKEEGKMQILHEKKIFP